MARELRPLWLTGFSGTSQVLFRGTASPQSFNPSISQFYNLPRGAFGKDTSRSAEASLGRTPSPSDVACYCGGDYSASAGGHDRGWVE